MEQPFAEEIPEEGESAEGLGDLFVESVAAWFVANKGVIDQYKPLLEFFILEIKKGTPFYAWEERRINKELGQLHKDNGAVTIQYVIAFRGFLLALGTLALTMLGAVLAVLSNPEQKVFHVTWRLHMGLALLGLCVSWAVIYLLHKFMADGEYLGGLNEMHGTIGDDLRDLVKSHRDSRKPFMDYVNSNKDAVEKAKTREREFMSAKRKSRGRKELSPVVIGYSFLLGATLIVVAFFC